MTTENTLLIIIQRECMKNQPEKCVKGWIVVWFSIWYFVIISNILSYFSHFPKFAPEYNI
jgi:hypothetical protein